MNTYWTKRETTICHSTFFFLIPFISTSAVDWSSQWVHRVKGQGRLCLSCPSSKKQGSPESKERQKSSLSSTTPFSFVVLVRNVWRLHVNHSVSVFMSILKTVDICCDSFRWIMRFVRMSTKGMQDKMREKDPPQVKLLKSFGWQLYLKTYLK